MERLLNLSNKSRSYSLPSRISKQPALTDSKDNNPSSLTKDKKQLPPSIFHFDKLTAPAQAAPKTEPKQDLTLINEPEQASQSKVDSFRTKFKLPQLVVPHNSLLGKNETNAQLGQITSQSNAQGLAQIKTSPLNLTELKSILTRFFLVSNADKTKFAVTGSAARCLQGNVDHDPNDIDILVHDSCDGTKSIHKAFGLVLVNETNDDSTFVIRSKGKNYQIQMIDFASSSICFPKGYGINDNSFSDYTTMVDRIPCIKQELIPTKPNVI
jgi:hypothetical protein